MLGLQREVIKELPPRFRNRVEVSQDPITLQINDNAFKFWELGTRPHIIKPRVKKSLSFEWPDHPADMQPDKNNKFKFKKVKHPGTEGHFILEKKATDRKLLEDLLERAIK